GTGNFDRSGVADILWHNSSTHETQIWMMNERTEMLVSAMSLAETIIAPLAGPLWPKVALALRAGIAYIETGNKLGGNNGVDIHGVIGTQGLIVTPRIGRIYQQLIQAARFAVSGRTILDFVLMASSRIPALAGALGVPVAATIFKLVASGTPLGWAI